MVYIGLFQRLAHALYIGIRDPALTDEAFRSKIDAEHVQSEVNSLSITNGLMTSMSAENGPIESNQVTKSSSNALPAFLLLFLLDM